MASISYSGCTVSAQNPDQELTVGLVVSFSVKYFIFSDFSDFEIFDGKNVLKLLNLKTVQSLRVS